MLSMNGDLAAKVSTEDNHAAEVEKAEMMDALDQVLDRVRELEEVIFNQSAKIKELTDTVQAERVMLARYELTNQVDELLRKLNK
jgi:wobble nucleotide-excising tRNase